MIIIRIGLTSERRLPGISQSTQKNSVFHSWRERPGSSHTSANPGYEMKSIVVNVTQHTGTDTETVLDREESVRSDAKADNTSLFDR